MGQTQATTAAPTLPPDAPVVRVAGPDASAHASVGPDRPLLILGSRRDCDLSIPSGEVAKTHAAIAHTGSAILVVDLCSRTGTWLDGKRVRRGALAPGRRLQLGPVELTLEFTQPPQQNDPQQALRFGHPLRLEGPNQTIELCEQPVVIGRRSVCDLVIDTPDTSLAHALIFELAGQPVVADLASRSGTLLDGQRIQLAPLHDGATLTIGGETFTVHDPHTRDAAAAPQQPAAARSAAAVRGAAAEGPTDPVVDADIELLLAGLEQRIVSLRAQLRLELDALEQRKHDLLARERQIATQAEQLAAQSRDLEQRQTDLDNRDRELQETAAALQREQKRLASGEKRLQQATRELTQQRRKLEQAETRIQQRTAELDTRQRQLEQAAASIESARAELSSRSSELEQRQQALDQRERQLDEQAAKLEQARNALRQARQLLGNLDALVEDDPPARTSPDPAQPAEAARSPNLLRRLLGNAETPGP